ncbi:TatD family hydrolase [Pelomonas aquatica]|jgi:TatD DNase family protein|uniref:TatD family deoxyribonuclease n=1 Tax=Pelomonas aquatica TaxID=431058 RepID=A0A9X4LIV7_9BURK|nr:TatD family hydrolase [Pelomonas aquatica]MCY4755097.1 TatD family hydrolase [Pelomonas aquatica]MDG0860888.1 TatD family deoxyribonuclease [Pelomonas aquatica]
MFVDSHCHLSFPELQQRLPDILSDMRAAQVAQAICICTQMEEFDAVHALALAHPQLWSTVGVHPDTEDMREPDVAELVRLAALPRVVAIGETGLDYYRLNGRSIADMEWQRERFRTHIRAARQAAKPLVIHTRSSAADTLRVLDEEGGEQVGGVFHCFTESADVALAAVERGYYISFSGIVSFKNAQDLRDLLKLLPLERVLIETDSPYLAPVPFRGKTNTPAYVPHVAKAVADAVGLAVPELAAITTANTRRLFGLPEAVA